jgi:hypothetical protein
LHNSPLVEPSEWLKKIGIKRFPKNMPYLSSIMSWLYKKPFAIWKMITTIVTIFSALFFFFYGLGYCFIYGYYLSGDIEKTPSLLSVAINPVPINFYSIVIISLFLFLSSFCLFSLTSLRQIKFSIAFIFISITLISLHMGISMFFVPGNDISAQVISFLPIWIIPFVLVTYITSIFTVFRHPIIFLVGLIYNTYTLLFILGLYGERINNVLYTEYAVFLMSLILFLSSKFVRIFQKCYKRYLGRIVILLPFVTTLVMIIYIILYELLDWNYPRIIGTYISLILSLFFTLISAIYVKKKQLKAYKKQILERSLHDPKKAQSDFDFKKIKILRNLLFCVVPCLLILICTLTTFVSLIAGNYIRTFSPENFRRMDIIEDYRENRVVKGNVIKIEGNKYYISNEKWELEILQSDHIHVRNIEGINK